MPIITGLSGTTELDAVNAMLSAIGEAELDSGTDLSTATQVDVRKAIAILTDATREVLGMGWKFNSEIGYEVAPAGTYDWVDTAGVTTTLNIFTPPAGMISFTVTQIAEQIFNCVDTELRVSRKYTPGTLVFYNRSEARDGFDRDKYPFLYINPVWYVDFEKMPESARRYTVMKAARRMAEDAVGSQTLSQFSARDEQLALRTLKREQGMEDDYRFLSGNHLHDARGGRVANYTGRIDSRRNRNSV